MTRLLFTLLLIAFLILLSSPVLAVQWRVLSQVDEMTLVEKKYAYRESSSTPSSETFGKRVSFLASCGASERLGCFGSLGCFEWVRKLEDSFCQSC
jgi:hypothetical protein